MRLPSSLQTRASAITREGRGFTLVEVLVVLVIIGVLLVIAVSAPNGFRDRSADAAAKANVREAMAAVKAYFSDNQTRPRRATASAMQRHRAPSTTSAGPTGSITTVACVGG